jgi:flagellar hook-associated protein 3 FlgL
VTTPGNDPAAAATDVEIHASLDQNQVYRANSQDATSWLNETQANLQAVSSYLSQAYQLAIEAANGTSTPGDDQAIAQQVRNLLVTVQQVEATTYEGLPLFGGTAGALPGSAAFTSPTNQPLTRRIGPSLTIPVSVTDYAAFQATGVDQSLQTLYTDLNAGNTAQLATDAQAVQQAQSQLLAVIASVGANASLAQSTYSSLQNQEVTLETLDQQTVGADAAQVAASYGLDQNIYQDALAAAAKVLQPTLLNYLA